MNFIKRAWFAVIRKPSRTIIMLIIFAAIANLVLTGFAIQHATDMASTLARQKLGSTLTFQFNNQAAMEKARQSAGTNGRPNFSSITREPVTETMVSTIAAQKNVMDYNIIVKTDAMASGFTAVSTSSSSSASSTANNDQQTQQGGRYGYGGGENSQQQNITMPDVTVTGVRSTELDEDFSEGATLISGRHITAADKGAKVVVIETNLASENNLKVGNSITMTALNSSTKVSYKIVGIYKAADMSSTGGGFQGATFSQPYNNIYMDYESALNIKNTAASASSSSSSSSSSNGGFRRMFLGSTPGIDSAEFYLNDPAYTNTALTQIQKMSGIDWTKFSITADDSTYQEMVKPIQQVAQFSMIVVYLVGIIGAIILALILLLNVKERMYETGVLLSMGESRTKIVLQYVAEMVMIAAVAFAVSCFTGQYIAQATANYLITNTLNSDNNSQTTQYGGNGQNDNGQGGYGQGNGMRNQALNRIRTNGGGVNRNVKPISSLKTSITYIEIGELCGAGLLIILLATIIPAVNIMRYNPKKILTKAN